MNRTAFAANRAARAGPNPETASGSGAASPDASPESTPSRFSPHRFASHRHAAAGSRA